LGLSEDAVVGLFCGRMYPRKQLERLVAAAQLVRENIPGFNLVLAGAGDTQIIAETAAKEHDFIHYVGPVFDERKAAFYAASRFVAFSGLLGLGIVDAFHYEVPPVVADYPFHSPEIAYLVDGENGLLTEDSVEDLARGMVRICLDDELHAKLVAGCKEWSQRLTIEEMADRFAEGILAALRDVKGRVDLSPSSP
jgi:glycosyltransferase involved in cell wall biosynthesis